ncbi:hypothetical protein NJT12_05890 [Flavobacterium sp. AC]|uniref:Uncharacterized protein n=1 Tax=Flavobacterium azizsancarii TaxID=2961580 RepID=A0ABT4WAK0_9FLAO|nr:hypothetical protein [Flavobacterium azizsancarii]MDA6069145.1 hypothetical protein [Flavobacterium azizsancarii]
MVKQSSIRNRINTSIRLLSLVGALFVCVVAQSQTITVGGTDWTPVIPTITEAGSDYVGTYESSSSQINLSLAVPLLLGTGKVSVRYEPNPTWNNSLKIDVRKLNNGSGLCVLCSMVPDQSAPYQEVLTSDAELFRVTAVLSLATVTNIGLNLRIRGVSVIIPVANYSARIVFTIGPT